MSETPGKKEEESIKSKLELDLSLLPANEQELEAKTGAYQACATGANTHRITGLLNGLSTEWLNIRDWQGDESMIKGCLARYHKFERTIQLVLAEKVKYMNGEYYYHDGTKVE